VSGAIKATRPLALANSMKKPPSFLVTTFGAVFVEKKKKYVK
jgi:hypothetical protein